MRGELCWTCRVAAQEAFLSRCVQSPGRNYKASGIQALRIPGETFPPCLSLASIPPPIFEHCSFRNCLSVLPILYSPCSWPRHCCAQAILRAFSGLPFPHDHSAAVPATTGQQLPSAHEFLFPGEELINSTILYAPGHRASVFGSSGRPLYSSAESREPWDAEYGLHDGEFPWKERAWGRPSASSCRLGALLNQCSELSGFSCTSNALVACFTRPKPAFELQVGHDAQSQSRPWIVGSMTMPLVLTRD